MYGKIFAQIFESTVNELDIHVRFVWIALLVICDKQGVVDMTPQSIARRINVPVDKVEEAISELCKSDPLSRSPEEDGRRLTAIRDGYGWKITNYEKYRGLKREADRREYMAGYMREKRADQKTPTATRQDARPAFVSDDLFEAEWSDYPEIGRLEKSKARGALRKSVTSAEDLDRFRTAKANYKKHLSIETWKHVMRASRFFREDIWSDWVDWQPPSTSASLPTFIPREGRAAR